MVFLGVTSFYYNLAEPYFSTHSIMYHIVLWVFLRFLLCDLGILCLKAWHNGLWGNYTFYACIIM